MVKTDLRERQNGLSSSVDMRAHEVYLKGRWFTRCQLCARYFIAVLFSA